jgi:hypothetical protein
MDWRSECCSNADLFENANFFENANLIKNANLFKTPICSKTAICSKAPIYSEMLLYSKTPSRYKCVVLSPGANPTTSNYVQRQRCKFLQRHE